MSNLIDEIKEPLYKKYLITDKVGALGIVEAKNRMEAITLFKKYFNDEAFEHADFRIDKITLEITREGDLIKYITKAKQEDGAEEKEEK